MIAWVGTTIIAAMLFQHWWIGWHTDRANWTRSLEFYRWVMRAAVILPVLFVFGSYIVIFLDFFYQQHFGIISRIHAFISDNTGPVSVLFIAFFAGVLRLFAERAIGGDDTVIGSARDLCRSFFDYKRLSMESSIGKISSGILNQKHDAWFGWMCLSLAVTFVNAIMDSAFSDSTPSTTSSASLSTGSSEAQVQASTNGSSNLANEDVSHSIHLIVALLSILYVATGYFLWIYMVLFAKLTQDHHLTSRAARLFLGRLFGDQVPIQSVLIGPPHAGKTYFCNQIAGSDSLGSGSPNGADRTTNIDIRNGFVTQQTTAGLLTYQLTTLDTPGENMGDHILLASIFRSDVLVFVLDREMLDIESLGDPRNYTVQDWHKLIVDRKDEAVKQTTAYLQGFHLATSRSEGGLIETKQLYKVKSFILYLNEKTPTQYLEQGPRGSRSPQDIIDRLNEIRKQLDCKQDHWQRLAQEVGRRFGVKAEDCCCIGGNASAQYGSHLLPYSTDTRLRKANWPENESSLSRD